MKLNASCVGSLNPSLQVALLRRNLLGKKHVVLWGIYTTLLQIKFVIVINIITANHSTIQSYTNYEVDNGSLNNQTQGKSSQVV
jgi:hypothetical protein